MLSALTDLEANQLVTDDAPYGDLTTSLLVESSNLHMHFYAREEMVVSGVEEVAQMAQLKGLNIECFCSSGDHVNSGQLILTIEGHSQTLFMVWKATQVLMEWMSGVATSANNMVKAANGIPVACTRKQTPFTKALSVKAIRSGGAVMHRLGLSETILVFSEHRQFNQMSPGEMLTHLRKSAPENKVVLEVHTVEDAKKWIEVGVDVLQLDKFGLQDVLVCRQYINSVQSHTRLAIAGGVNLNNVAEYAYAGADIIVTSSPYYAKPKDIKVIFQSQPVIAD